MRLCEVVPLNKSTANYYELVELTEAKRDDDPEALVFELLALISYNGSPRLVDAVKKRDWSVE